MRNRGGSGGGSTADVAAVRADGAAIGNAVCHFPLHLDLVSATRPDRRASCHHRKLPAATGHCRHLREGLAATPPRSTRDNVVALEGENK